jgi:ArsR family transcriptional regulator
MAQVSKSRSRPLPAAEERTRLEELLEPEFFRALCDPRRNAILAELAGCCAPLPVTQAAQCCPVDLSVVSRHLAVLRRAGLVHAERRGREVHYTVNVTAIAERLRAVADALESCCGVPPQPGTAQAEEGDES